jgi:aldehyde dehydrogenase (NAD+)
MPESNQSYQYIDAAWQTGDSDRTITTQNPAQPSETVSEFPAASRSQAATAVDAAVAASEGWANSTPEDRDAILFSIADKIEANVDELSEILTQEEGKAISSSRGEVLRTAKMFRHFAADARRATGDTVPSNDPNTFTYTLREPLGVVAVVTPWNFPITIPGWKLAPALATGNAVVFKPSSLTPGIAKRFVELIEEAGLPDGVLNLVVGPGSEVGDELSTNPGIDGLTFTGSTVVGQTIAEATADRDVPIPAQTEMGGKNPQVVLPDADLDNAADAVTSGAFGGTGQACTATSRLIVHKDIADELTNRVIDRAGSYTIGPGMQDSDMGPAVDENQDQTNFDYIDLAQTEGATLRTGGERPDGFNEGYFVEPTVFTDVNQEMRIANEEVFGPVLSVITVSDFDEAVSVANDVKYGLSASIFTSDMARARAFIRRVEAGVVKINGTTTGSDIQMPFGGMKASSSETFKELGQRAYEFYTHEKAVYRTDA